MCGDKSAQYVSPSGLRCHAWHIQKAQGLLKTHYPRIDDENSCMSSSSANAVTDAAIRHPLSTALALSMGAAISLGISRFSYALLLPPMRDDLGWSYLLAGAMNTGNAFGYL